MNGLLDTKEASHILCVSPSLMKRWRAEGQGPKFVMLGPKLIRYTPEGIQAYINGLAMLSSTSEAADH
jgi:predicted DNA-binding transcriptional regulator AlpA